MHLTTFNIWRCYLIQPVLDRYLFAAEVEPEPAVLAGTQGSRVGVGSEGRLQVDPGVPRHAPVLQAQHTQLRADLRQELHLSWRPRKHRGCALVVAVFVFFSLMHFVS